MEYSPFSYRLHDDPYPVYRWLRDEAPCYHNREHDFFALSRFEDVWAALLDWETFSSRAGPAIEQSEMDPEAGSVLAMDPPRHTRIRNLVSRAFTPRRIAAMEPEIRRIAAKHLDPLRDRDHCDLFRDFAALLPMDVISALIGIPEQDRQQVRVWAEDLLHRDPDSSEPPAVAREAQAGLYRCMSELLAERRARPRDDLTSVLAQAEYSHEGEPTRLEDAEVIAFCTVLAAAGNETTAKLISTGAVTLARHPEQRALLWEDPSRIPLGIEEMLRWDAPLQYQGRITTRDVELHGQTIPRGSRVILILGAASRDEREFDAPDRFDVRRRTERQVYFGHGHHVCIGMSLARLEARIAFEEIAARFPDFEVDEAGLERQHQANVRGYGSVPIHY